MAMIVDGSKIANKILIEITERAANLKKKKIFPKLGIILVGKDRASEVYVEKKAEACRRVGVDFILKKYSVEITTDQLIKEVENIQKKEKLSGLIIQLPLPKKINTQVVLNHIKPAIDVDYLTEKKLGTLISGYYQIEPPTPGAILEIFKHYHIKLDGQKIVLVGAGALIGRPLFNLLLFKKATVMVCNNKTKNLGQIIKQADILITGVGKRNLVKGSMLKNGVKIIDGGISFFKGKVYGDVNFNQAIKKASLITPTPGGVGPITVAKLVESVVENARNI